MERSQTLLGVTNILSLCERDYSVLDWLRS